MPSGHGTSALEPSVGRTADGAFGKPLLSGGGFFSCRAPVHFDRSLRVLVTLGVAFAASCSFLRGGGPDPKPLRPGKGPPAPFLLGEIGLLHSFNRASQMLEPNGPAPVIFSRSSLTDAALTRQRSDLLDAESDCESELASKATHLVFAAMLFWGWVAFLLLTS